MVEEVVQFPYALIFIDFANRRVANFHHNFYGIFIFLNLAYYILFTGIAACGRTPFVWGSIYRAISLNAFTAFLTFNTELELKVQPNVFIAMDLGAEILTGSTRLKCGTATKCVLNMLSTLAMVKYGKCFENLMVDLNPANEKLRQRSIRIVLLMTKEVENLDEDKAKEVLLKNKYDIRKTINELRGVE